MVQASVAALIGLVGVLVGALGAAWVVHMKIAVRLTALERDFQAERTRTDTRIFEVVGLVKAVIELAKEDRETWRDLLAEMRALSTKGARP